MNDLIDRRAAINVIKCDTTVSNIHQRNVMIARLTDAIKRLPSAQPYTEADIQKMQDLYQAEIDKAFELGQEDARSEIIHCGECKYYHDSDGCFFSTATTGADGFCHWAERKEGEE